MKLLSMRFRRGILRVFGILFILGALLGLSGEFVLAQWKVNSLGKILSAGPVVALIKSGRDRKALVEHLDRRRVSMGFERIEIFDGNGQLLAGAPSGAPSGGHGEGEIHGVLTSSRTGIRSAGREIAHVVIWRNMDAEVARPLIAGLIIGLLGALIAWPILARRLGEEQAV